MNGDRITAEHVGQRVRVRLRDFLGHNPVVTGTVVGFSLKEKELGADIDGEAGTRYWFRLASCELLETLSAEEPT